MCCLLPSIDFTFFISFSSAIALSTGRDGNENKFMALRATSQQQS
jgi:hypothetical protein